MGLRWVNINKTIPREDLEKILIEAAGDIGLKAKTVQKYKTEYELGSVKEVKKPGDRFICLRNTLPFAEAEIFSGNKFIIRTFLHTYRFCVATKGQVEKYLEAVSKRVGKYRPQAA